MSARGSPHLALAVLVFVGLLASTREGLSAPQAADVEDLIRRGNDLRRKGLDSQALPLFQQAYDLAGTPRAAAQIGLCKLQLGYALEAEQHLTEALAASQDPWVRQYRDALNTSLRSARSRVGEVIVLGSPLGAEIVVNGRSAGRLPLPSPIRVGAGGVKIEARAPGYAERQISVVVKGKQREEVTVDLALMPGPRAMPSVPLHSATTEVPPRNLELPKPNQPESTSPGSARVIRSAGWASGIAAAGLLILGVTETIVHEQRVSDFDNQSKPVPDERGGITLQPLCSVDQADRGGVECRGIYDDIQRAKTLAIVGYVGAGAMAITSGLLFALSRTPPEKRTIACAPSLLPLSAGCRISF